MADKVLKSLTKTECESSGKTVANPREPSRRPAVQDIDIEALLVWTYRTQAAAHVDRRAGRTFGASARSMFAQFAEIERLGCRVDGGGVRVAAEAIHPDAETVHEAVCRLPVEQGGLILRHAHAGTEPEWRHDPAVVVRPARRAANGRPDVSYADPERRRGAYVEITIGPEVAWDIVEMERAEYGLWVDGLEVLGRELAGALVAHRVRPTWRPRTPWAKKVA